jgi:hypothetical protein
MCPDTKFDSEISAFPKPKGGEEGGQAHCTVVERIIAPEEARRLIAELLHKKIATAKPGDPIEINGRTYYIND